MGWFFNKKKGKNGKKASSEDIRKEALENMRKARERIGEDNVQKMAESLMEQGFKPPPGMELPEKSAGKKARDKIAKMDKGHVADHVRSVLKEK